MSEQGTRNLGEIAPSISRAASFTGTPFKNRGARGIIVFLTITVASGSGGLKVRIMGKDPKSDNWYQLHADPTAVTATGQKAYTVYPGIGTTGGDVASQFSAVVPEDVRVDVNAGDSSSYTYSVGACLLK